MDGRRGQLADEDELDGDDVDDEDFVEEDSDFAEEDSGLPEDDESAAGADEPDSEPFAAALAGDAPLRLSVR